MNLNLLPPSAFQGKTPPSQDVQKERSQAAEELEKLKQENEQLRSVMV